MGPVTDEHRVTYRENVKLAVAERKAVFDSAFMFDPNLSGEQARMVEIIAPQDARIDAAVGGPTPTFEAQHEPVWCLPRRIDQGKVIEVEDQIKALTDFKSEYTQVIAQAMVRGKNSILVPALFGTRLIGKQGATSSSAWAGSTVAVAVGGADTSMNVAKLMRALRYFEEAEIILEEEEIFCALDAEENESLYNDIKFVNTDYRSKAVLEEKRVREILGVKIIPTQRIADTGADSTAAVWCKSGMYWGQFKALAVNSAPNVDRQFREHVYAEQWIGAIRSEDKRVVKVLCKKA